MELPNFRYNPNALSLGVIIKEKTSCPVCKNEREYMYEGPFYAADDVEGICPWCILDGSAAKKYDCEFPDVDSCEDVDKQEYVDELIHRTPGYVNKEKLFSVKKTDEQYLFSHFGNLEWKRNHKVEFSDKDYKHVYRLTFLEKDNPKNLVWKIEK